MALTDLRVTYYQKLARCCGWWSAARHMRKQGFTLEQCREVLFGKGAV